VELRHLTRQRPDLHARQHKVRMLLALPSEAKSAWDGLDRKVRNQVRKAEKAGLTAREGGAELLDAFYDVFSRNMRDLGTPVYSPDFFREVLRAFPETARVFLVEHGTRPVAAGITIRHRDGLEVPWASSLREYRADCPNNLLYWQIIQHAIGEGLRVLDFGRSTPNEGTFHFKKQWGAEPSPLYWEYILMGGEAPKDLSPKNPKFGAAIAVWKRLPVSVTTALGPHIVRSIP
jgi:FemAB-related protein (PEP-CTERM system-associated)